MQLWSVPIMLEIYLVTRDRPDAELLAFSISDILEAEPGPVFLAELPDHEYRESVLEIYGRLCDALGSSEVAVRHGRPFSVLSTARHLLAMLTSPELDAEDVPEERMYFEAATGVDCRDFFDEAHELRPLAAASIVEEFLGSPEAARYEDGVRYFFGHRIPDRAAR